MTKPWKVAVRITLGLIAASVFLVPAAVAGLWEWFWMAFGFLLLVLGFEAWSTAVDGITISGKFWKWRDQHPVWAALLLASWCGGWVFFIWHLWMGHRP